MQYFFLASNLKAIVACCDLIVNMVHGVFVDFTTYSH